MGLTLLPVILQDKQSVFLFCQMWLNDGGCLGNHLEQVALIKNSLFCIVKQLASLCHLICTCLLGYHEPDKGVEVKDCSGLLKAISVKWAFSTRQDKAFREIIWDIKISIHLHPA